MSMNVLTKWYETVFVKDVRLYYQDRDRQSSHSH